jgi:hypothetical protein
MGGERRRSDRACVRAYANKYIAGSPHTVQVLDVSERAVKIRRIFEPESAGDAFPLELWFGDSQVWTWSRRIWRWGPWEALAIVSADALDHARFRKFLRANLGT